MPINLSGWDGPLIDAERLTRGYLAALDETSASWAPGWTVDVKCSDLPRVVRCPGSVNQATGKRAIVEFEYRGEPIDVNLLMRYNASPALQDAPAFVGAVNLLEALPHLNIRARTFILDGAVSPGRHSACYATCKNMHELGIPIDRAFEWLMIGSNRCRHAVTYAQMPLRSEEVVRIVKQVYGERKAAMDKENGG